MKITVHEVWRSNSMLLKWLRAVLLWACFVMALQAQAATYSLPTNFGSGPFGNCSLSSGTTYRCTAAVILSNNDIVNLTSSLTMNVVNNGFRAGNNVTINSNGFSFQITATEDVNIGNGFIGEVSITASGKTINIGNNAQVTGNLTAGTLNIGSGSVINGYCAPSNSKCTGLVVPKGTFFPVPITTGLLNQDITSWSGGSLYSPYMNGGQTLGGVPFTMQTSASGMNVVWGTSTSVFSVASGRTYTNTVTLNTNLYGATKVYALINSAWGNGGSTVGSITFNASNGDSYTVSLVEGVNVRDHYYGGFVNTISADYVTMNVIGAASSGAHLDMQAFALPASFATEILSSIVFTATGSNLTGLPFLAGTTVDAARFGIDHVRLDHAGAGLTCMASTITVTACQSPDSNGSCTASTMGISGNVYATNAAGTFATKAFTIPSGSISTTVTIADPTAETLTLSAGAYSIIPSNPSTTFSCWNSASGSASCSHTYSNAGFIFSSVANGGVATIPAQVAGTSSGIYYLRAVKTNTTTKACEAALAGSNSVSFGYECNNPAICASSDLMTVNGSASAVIARNNNGAVSNYATVGMVFDGNGNAPFTFNFGDVGLVTLHARKAAGGTLSSTLTGVTNAFVVAPASFAFSGITAAPIKAGNNFSATVTALGSTGAPTPNFGKESTAEGVTLSFSKCQPTGPAAVPGTFGGSVGAFNNGAASTSSLSWSEVGNGDLTATLASGNYLGSGLPPASGNTGTGGTVCNGAGNVGRFVPDHFDTVVTEGCVAGSFTYSGQPFAVQVTARNQAGNPTRNYDGSANTSPNFAKVVTLSDANVVAGSFVPNTIGASAFAAGVASANPAFRFTSVTTAPATIRLHAVDTDNVASSATEGTAIIRSGRARLASNHGSELLDLPLALQAQYWNGNAWVLNAADTCTTGISLVLTDPMPADGLTPGELCVWDSGNPGNSGLGCAAAGTVANRFKEPPTAVAGGDFNLNLRAPGAGNTGSMNVTATVPGWLQFDWTGTGKTNPTARATFGLRKTPIIYMRENF